MSPSQLRIERKPFRLLGPEVLQQWVALLRESVSTRWAFLTPAYARCVDEVISAVEVVLLWDGSKLAGVMPLQPVPDGLGRFGLWEPAGGGMTDYFGLLCRPGIQLAWAELLKEAALPCLYFTHLDEEQGAHGLHGDSPRKGLRTRIHPDGGAAHWDWLKVQDKKLTYDTERRERKLISDHGELLFEPDVVVNSWKVLTELIELKNAQYKRTGHITGALLSDRNAHLLMALMTLRDPDCLPRLSTLRIGGQLIAAHFGLQCGSVLHFWFPAYSQTFSSYSPGRILLRRILLASDSLGVRCIDRGEGESQAKRDFATEEHFFYKGLVAQGVWGAVLSASQRAIWKWRT